MSRSQCSSQYLRPLSGSRYTSFSSKFYLSMHSDKVSSRPGAISTMVADRPLRGLGISHPSSSFLFTRAPHLLFDNVHRAIPPEFPQPSSDSDFTDALPIFVGVGPNTSGKNSGRQRTNTYAPHRRYDYLGWRVPGRRIGGLRSPTLELLQPLFRFSHSVSSFQPSVPPPSPT